MPHAITRVRVAKVPGQEETYFWPRQLSTAQSPSATLSELVQFWPSRSAVPGDVWRSLAGRSKRQPPKPPQSDKAASPDGRRKRQCKGGPLTRRLAWRRCLRCRATTPAPLRLSSCAVQNCDPRFALGHRLIPERGRFTGLALIPLTPGCLSVNHSLNVWFRRCSSVVGSSSVSEFA
jgi:hypothetical protein